MGSFKSDGQQSIGSYLTSTTDITQTVVAYGRHTHINPQLYYYNGPFGLLAEWVKEYQQVAELTTTGSTFGTGAYNNTAGHVTVSGALGGDVDYEGNQAAQAARSGRRHLRRAGAGLPLRLAERRQRGVSNRHRSDQVGPRGPGLRCGAQLAAEPQRRKVDGDYEQTSFTGGAKTGNRPTEKVLLGRFQVAF